MVCLRMHIKSYKDRETYNKIVKVDFNSIKVFEEKKGVYKSYVSQERIYLNKKNKLYFHLTKFDKNYKIFIYEYLVDTESIQNAEKLFYLKVVKHFKMFYSLFFRKEMKKIISISQTIDSREKI